MLKYMTYNEFDSVVPLKIIANVTGSPQTEVLERDVAGSL